MTFAWEPRGKWNPDEVCDLCEELGLVHGIDPFSQQTTTKRLGYFRLHGRGGYRYRYTNRDLEHLFEMTRHRKPCYVLFNNMAMLEDARSFLKLTSNA